MVSKGNKTYQNKSKTKRQTTLTTNIVNGSNEAVTVFNNAEFS